MEGKLILSDGSEFYGKLLNNIKACGEVVFFTGVTGYQELLTDPSYCRQIVTMTYPLIGNVGVAERFMQSRKAFAKGIVIGELCEHASNWQMENSLENFLTKQGIPCLYDADTRAITRRIRNEGAMKGIIVPADASKAEIDELMNAPLRKDSVAEVTTPETYVIEGAGKNVVVLDLGLKKNVIVPFEELGCKLTVMPAKSSIDEIMSKNPDGVFLSNGPESPEYIPEVVDTVKKLAEKKIVTFGVDLGSLVIAEAFGAKVKKMKFGHHGVNQPVKDLATGKVDITAQGHSYVIDENSLKDVPLKTTHISLNDGTVEGFEHESLPIFATQYHPSAEMYQKFVNMLTKGE